MSQPDVAMLLNLVNSFLHVCLLFALGVVTWMIHRSDKNSEHHRALLLRAMKTFSDQLKHSTERIDKLIEVLSKNS